MARARPAGRSTASSRTPPPTAPGITGFFEVRPFLKAGTATGAVVTLVRPSARMMLEPGSFDPGTEGPVNTTGMAFNAIEVR